MAKITLTRPQGIGGVPGTSTLGIVIPSITNAPNNAVVVDTSSYSAVKWLYSLTDETDNTKFAAEVLAIKNPGSPIEPKYNRYGIVGDRIKHTIEVKVDGSNLAFEITNLHTNELKADIVQIQITLP